LVIVHYSTYNTNVDPQYIIYVQHLRRSSVHYLRTIST